MRECRTSGSVGGRRGDPPVYPTPPQYAPLEPLTGPELDAIGPVPDVPGTV
jgi:hypothetical protein